MGSETSNRSVGALQSEGVLRVEDGNHGEYRPRREEFTAVGVAFIRAADVRGGMIDFTHADKVNGAALARIHKGIGQPGDLILTHKGTVGRIARVPPDAPPFVCSPQTTFWRVLDASVLDSDYLFAFLRSPMFARQLRERMHETDMAPYVSLTAQREFTVPIPPITEQRAVGSIVRALDDKIDSNRRLAQLLEQIVHTEFRARFADFIGVANLQDALARVPTGWHAGVVDEIGSVHRDLIKGASDLPYIGLDLMPRGSTVLTEWREEDAPIGQAALFEVGDILFGKLRPYFRKVGVAPIAGRCSTEILVLRPVKPEYYGVLLGHVASEAFIAHSVAVSRGTRMPRAEWKDASAFKIAIPPEEVAAAFTALVQDLYAKVRSLMHESRTLASIRDTLLPKLVSGQIRVPDTADPGEVIQPLVEGAA